MEDYSDLYAGLSEEPFTASFELVTRVEKKILRGHPSEVEYSAACGILEAFWESNSWRIPEPVSTRSASNVLGTIAETSDQAVERLRQRFRFQFEAYRNQALSNRLAATKASAVESLDAAVADKPGYALLTPEEKKEIHGHLEGIRSIIEASDLDDRKKNSLFSYIDSLSREVNRNGTRTDRFFAFTSELGFYLGEFTKNAKPLFDEAKEVLKIVTRARARNEQLQLPPNGEVLSLPEPNSAEAS